MILAEVVGTVVSSRKDPALEGLKLLAVQPLGKGLAPTGSILVAVDSVGAGPGEVVLIVSGSSARYTAVTSGRPADASILAIVDQVASSGATIYDKRGSGA
jgi:ethanolamine utilization protein EutN